MFSADVKIYTEENGLAGAFANYTYKDSRGILWMGTQYGLHRFDGRDFVVFDEENVLPFSQIMEIYEDDEGYLWLFRSCLNKPNCTPDLAFFHPQTQEVLSFAERFGKQTDFTPTQIGSIFRTDKGIFYLIVDDQLVKWSSLGGFHTYKNPDLKGLALKYTLTENMLLGYSVHRTYMANPTLTSYVIDTLGNILYQQPSDWVSNRNRKLFQGVPSAHQWDFSDEKIPLEVKKNLAKHVADLTQIPLPNGQRFDDLFTLSVLYPFDEELWLVGGTKIVHPDKGILYDLYDEYPALFDGWNCRQTYYDPLTHTIWLAGRIGFMAVQFKKNYFKPMLSAPPKIRKILSLGAFCDTSDYIFLTTEKGILHIQNPDLSDMRSVLEVSSDGANSAEFPYTRLGIPYLSVRDQTGAYWGFKYYGIRIDPKDFQVQFRHLPGRKELWNRIYSAYPLKEGFLLGADQGIFVYQPEKDEVLPFTQYNEFERLKETLVHFFITDRSGLFIWIGTNDGLYAYSVDHGIFARFGMDEEGGRYLPAQAFQHLANAEDGGYWLATKEGLIYWRGNLMKGQNNDPHIKVDTFQHFTNKDRLISNDLYAVYEDDFGFLWIPTNKGLIQFQKTTGKTRTYLPEDGLSDRAFELYAHGLAKDGKLILGGVNGFNVFHPRDFKDGIQDSLPNIPITILSYEQFSGELNKLENKTQELLMTQKITIGPNDKLFSLKVSLEDYWQAEHAKFAYRIDGYQDIWQEGKENLIRISGLPYGDYSLQIKARLPSGEFSSNELTIPIEVIRPVYMQTWFLGGILLSAIILVIITHKWRTRQLKRKQKVLEEIIEERTSQIRKDKRTIETDKRKIEQQAIQLRNLDTIKSRFFTNVSHEIRTPLTLMLGPISSTLKSSKLNDKHKDYLRMAQKNGQVLLKLVNEILDLSRLEDGNVKLEERAVHFENFLKKQTIVYESHANIANVQFAYRYLLGSSLWIALDVNKFERIFNNLLSNAFKFTPKGGKVTVTVEERTGYIRIAISDTGRGIHPDDLPYIFDRFYQSSQPDASSEGGTGIGLALSQELAKLINAQLWVESQLGEGTTFYVEFPLKIAQPLEIKDYTFPPYSPISELSLSPVPKVDRFSQTVMIVEDNPDLRIYLTKLLDEFYQIIPAENGLDAWEQLTGGISPLPSLILSDIMMPQMDGYQLLEKLKMDQRFLHIPVVMLTARAEMKDKLKALRIGVDDYLLKPFEEEELLARIKNLLKNSLSRQLFPPNTTEQIPVLNGNMIIKEEKQLSKLQKPQQTYSISSDDLEWLETLERTLAFNLNELDFGVEMLAVEMSYSRRQLTRRVKRLTGLSPSAYIREFRLNAAKKLLEDRSHNTVKAVALEVGLKDMRNFSRIYKERFGKRPSEYL